MPVAQIATALHPGTGAVRNHLSNTNTNTNAIDATGAANRIEGARLAHEQGWIQMTSHACGKRARGCPL